MEQGKIVGFAGRAIDGTEPKWLTPLGSKRPLWNLGNIRPGGLVVVMENYVDAALLMQEYPDIDAVATGMARALKGQEVQYMKDRGVKYVVVAMDNDLAGQASGEMREHLTQEWMETHDAPPPEGAGHKTYKMLRAMRMGAVKLLWTGCPPKADIGWAIEQGVIGSVLNNKAIGVAA